jgi:Cu/Ag efflux protein CusF
MKRIFVHRAQTERFLGVAMILLLTLIALSVAACKKSSDESPGAIFQAFYESLKNKDVEAYKKTVSKNTLQILERRAKEIDRTLDAYIKMDMDKPTRKLPDKLETRNEKIEGDRATLEVKNTEGGWNTVPFVKEDGQWKVSIDKI